MVTPADTEKLRIAAEAGDAKAQYHLAALLTGSGKRDEADDWLKRSAAADYPDAIYTLATREFGTLEGLRAVATDVERAAAAGCALALHAQAALALRGWGTEQDPATAAETIVGLARRGEPNAMASVATSLAALNPELAAIQPLLQDASRSGSPTAAAVRLRRFVTRGGDDPAEIKRLAEALIRARYPNAETLGIMVRDRIGAGPTQTPQSPPATPSTASSLDWEEITSVLAAPSPQINDKDYRKVVGEKDGATASGFTALVIEELLPPEVCEHLIAVSAQLLMASKVFDPTTGTVREDPYRNSATAVIGPSDLDYGAAFIGYLIAKAANKDYDTAEFLSVLRYAPGQEYKPHFDWLPEGDELRRSGQRATTALLYLVDDYEGGETAFTEVGAAVRGKAGDLLIFENLDTEGQPNMVSRHASLPVKKGVKWIASQWYRERPFDF